MKERLNVKNITLNETADELAYKGIKESNSLKGYSTWSFGKGYRKPFNKFQEYTSEVDKRTDTNKFIEKLNFKGKGLTLQEGAGAGYDLKVFDIKIDNVVLNKVYKNNIGVQTADFEADIVPGTYDWRAVGYDWSVDSGERNYIYDENDLSQDIEVEPALIEGKVWGTWENPIQNFQDENADDYPEDKIKNEIRGESFDLGDSLSWGWVHSDIPAKWDIEEEVGREDHYDKPIDLTDESDRYKFSYVNKASIEFKEVEFMNSSISIVMNPWEYFEDQYGAYAEEADTYEDYLHYANRTNGTPMSKEEWENVTGIKEDPQLELPFGESKKRVKEKNSGTVEVLLYFKNPVERQKALDFLKGKMDAYKFDDYYSYDFKGAVTKGALDRGVVVYGSYNGKIADEALDIINYVKEICPYEVVDSTYIRAIDESKKRVKEFYTPSPNKEKFWKDPNHPQARAERDWWLHRVRTSKNNIWENDGAFDFADHDAKESLRKFGKIYVDPETGKPVEPNYVRNLIDEWGDKE